MTDSNLVHQLALLNWLINDTEESKELLTVVTGIQVAKDVLNHLASQDKIDAYKKECILNIAEYVRKNPRASQQELNKEVTKQVSLFALRVEALG